MGPVRPEPLDGMVRRTGAKLDALRIDLSTVTHTETSPREHIMRNTLKALAIYGAVSTPCTPGVLAQQPGDVTLEGVSVDHVIVSLPSTAI
jgi:hypothetical protein